MRTTLDLPAPLLAEALRVTRQKTKTAVIITALEDLIRKNRTRGIKKFKGKIDLKIDLDTLRDRRK
jgi:Arc/MetJ family transcription regulator